MSQTLLVLHGPNLNLLGRRRPEIYGSRTLADVNDEILRACEHRGFDAIIEQRNGEGELIDLLHRHAVGDPTSPGRVLGVILNPGAYAHHGYALRDAIESCEAPVIEVHISNIQGRGDEFRTQMVTASVCQGVIMGLGTLSYAVAVDAMRRYVDMSATMIGHR